MNITFTEDIEAGNYILLPEDGSPDPDEPCICLAEAGTTQTLPAGSLAAVTSRYEGGKNIFDFKIPKGDQGQQGPQGIPGASGGGSGGSLKNWFDITAYGAKQDSTTDNAPFIQAAINDCIKYKGTLFIPNTTGFGNFSYYRINSGLRIIGDASNDQLWMSILAQGHINHQIVYHGPNNGSVLTITGLKGGQIDNLKLRIENGITGTTCFDLGTNASSTTGGFSFRDCAASLGNGVNNKGWRVGGVSEGSNGDISNILWTNCNVWGAGVYGASGSRGFHIAGGNSLQFTWVGGGVAFTEEAVRIDKGGACYFYGMGGSGNGTDFNLNFVSALTIDGNRWENGKRFLRIGAADGHSSVRVINCTLGAYKPTDGYLIESGQNCTLIIDAFQAYKEGGLFTGPIMNLYNNGTSIGNLHWRGGFVQSSASSLVTVAKPSAWKQRIATVGKMNAAYGTTDYFPDVTT